MLGPSDPSPVPRRLVKTPVAGHPVPKGEGLEFLHFSRRLEFLHFSRGPEFLDFPCCCGLRENPTAEVEKELIPGLRNLSPASTSPRSSSAKGDTWSSFCVNLRYSGVAA